MKSHGSSGLQNICCNIIIIGCCTTVYVHMLNFHCDRQFYYHIVQRIAHNTAIQQLHSNITQQHLRTTLIQNTILTSMKLVVQWFCMYTLKAIMRNALQIPSRTLTVHFTEIFFYLAKLQYSTIQPGVDIQYHLHVQWWSVTHYIYGSVARGVKTN